MNYIEQVKLRMAIELWLEKNPGPDEERIAKWISERNGVSVRHLKEFLAQRNG